MDGAQIKGGAEKDVSPSSRMNRRIGSSRPGLRRRDTLRRVVAGVLSATVVSAALALIPAATAPAGATLLPADGEVTYKEYWVPHTQFTGACDSEPRPYGWWYVEPSPCSKTVDLQIPDGIGGAVRAEVYLDLWRNRNAPKVRFKINGNAVHAPDVGSDWGRTPWVGDIPLTELVQGTNTFTFTAFFPVHVHDIAVRVYQDATHPIVAGPGSDVTPPTGSLTSVVADNGAFNPLIGGVLGIDSNQISFAAGASDDRGVAYVDFVGRYEGYDIDADGTTREWQATGRNNWFPGGTEAKATGGLINHLGSDATAPYQVAWNSTHVPNQSGAEFKIRVVDTSGNVREAAGGISAPFDLVRSGEVETYSVSNFTDKVLHHDGDYPDTATDTIVLPDLTNVSAAYLVGNYWNNPNVSMNGHPEFRTHVGTADTWALSVRPIALDQMGPGVNDIIYNYRSPGFGQMIERPGPMIVLYRDVPDPAPPAIVSQPGDIAVSANMEARFLVKATGSPAPTFQWLRDGVEIPGATESTYTTSRVTAADDGAAFSVRLTNRYGSVTSQPATLTLAPPAPWWDSGFPYRVEVIVGAAGYERVDKPVSAGINFTAHLASIGDPGRFDPNAVRVVEVDAVGAVIDDYIQYQFDGVTSYNPTTNADGTIVFMLEGTTAANQSRRFHVYFAKTGSGIEPLPQTWHLQIIDNVADHGQAAYRIETPNTTWTYQKDAGGFSGIRDTDGNDWVSYNQTPGAAGSFRGIPNAVFPEGSLHPGASSSRSQILNTGPLHVGIRTTTLDGRFGIRWDFYPDYATAQITKARANYWFLYEGTPGGQLSAASDFIVRSRGEKTFVGQSWAGDLSGDEWLYFADGALDRSLFLAHHDDDNATDYYQPLDSAMTVFGFGRSGSEPQLRRSGERFTVGLIDTRLHPQAKEEIEGAYRDLSLSSGFVERRAGNTVPAAPTAVSARPQNESVLVTWEPVLNHGGALITGYVVTPSPNGDPVLVPADETSGLVAGLTNGEPYSFTVAAINDVGRGPDSDPVGPVAPTPLVSVTSDDFNSRTLDPRWSVYDPNLLDPAVTDYPAERFPTDWLPDPNAAADVVATGSELVIKVPPGHSSDLWTGRPFAPRVTQEVADTDFQVQLKIDSDPTELFQFQGFVAEQDPTNLLRFDVLFATAGGYSNGTLKVQAAAISDGVGQALIEEIAVTSSVRFLRVTRAGDLWTLEYSQTGTTWFEAGSFVRPLGLTRAGVFAGSHGVVEASTPQFISRFDYVFNTASPIDPEDPIPDTDPLQISDLQVSASDTRARVRWRTDQLSTGGVEFGATTLYEMGSVGAPDLDFAHDVLLTGLDPGTEYHLRVLASDLRSIEATSDDTQFQTVGGGAADTVIDVWQGDQQSFGSLGQPQRWVNILGNISDIDGVERAYYTLNGDPTEHPLSLGPNERRLSEAGDFNVEISWGSLRRGSNSVRINAVDLYGNRTERVVQVNADLSRTWPLPYSIDWSAAPPVEDVAQVVDGRWTGGSYGVKPVVPGYDRLIAIGDLSWTNYEVTVPITINSIDPAGYNEISSGPAVGLMLRWPGHYDWDGSQPRNGFAPLGALGWYRFHTNGVNQLVLSDSSGQDAVTSSQMTMVPGTTYVFKMSVQTEIGAGEANGHRYTLSVWEQGQPEQTAVTISDLQPLNGVPAGSAVLVAHHVDATFGDISVSRVNPSINAIVTPASGTYTTRQLVTITTPVNNSTIHYTLDGTTPTPNSPVYTGPFKLNADLEVRAIVVRQGLDQSAVTTRQYLIRKPTPIISDDFSGGAVNTDLWTVVDPRGDVRTRTTATDLLFEIPSGPTHDLFNNRLLAPRILQSAPNADFEVETRIMNTYSGTFTQAGIVVHQTFRDFLRFDVYRSGSSRYLFAGTFANGVVKSLINKAIAVTGDDVFIRVNRSGHDWTLSWSNDGSTWQVGGTFARPMVVTSVGPWAGSHSNSGTSPGFVGTFDYFFNTAAPVPDDLAVPNVAPVVGAGPNLSVTMPTSAVLDGAVVDDGLPIDPGTTMTSWSKVSGPGTVEFADATAVDTAATFDTVGRYVLRLAANDGQRSSFGKTTVTVLADPGAPVVDAGPKRTIAGTDPIALEGSALDPEPGPGPVVTTWLVAEGPGTVAFADASSVVTTATFSATGTYLLRLAATDGEHTSFDLVEVDVVPPRERDGLLALYDFSDGEGDIIADVSANGTPLDLHIGNATEVSWTRSSLRVAGSVEIASHEPATKITAPVKASNEVTVEAWVRPEHLNQIGPARIVSISGSSVSRDFTLGQGDSSAGTGARINGRLRTTATDSNGLPATVTGSVLGYGMQHVVYTRSSGGTASIYVDGVLVVTGTVGGSLANWDSSFPLRIANEAGGSRPWRGEYELLAFYDRALTPSQILSHYQHGDEIVGANLTPIVDAGPDLSIALPAQAILNGSVSDDRRPNRNGLLQEWSLVSGPAAVSFADPFNASTTATFSEPGAYLLQLAGDDGVAFATDLVTVSVAPVPTNAPPVVDAGADQSIEIIESAILQGSAGDDGNPYPGILTTSWSKVSGPGAVTFSGSAVPSTTALFSDVGTYVLRLTADDGEAVVSDDVTVAVVRPQRAAEGLVALYSFDEGAGSTVRDLSGIGTPLDLTIGDPSRTAWIDGALRIDSPTVVRTLGPATKINEALKATRSLTLETWIDPSALVPAGPGRIAGVTAGNDVVNLSLSQGWHPTQSTSNYRSKLRTTGTTTTPVVPLTHDGLQHVVVTRNNGDQRIRLYIDGVLSDTRTSYGDLSNWTATMALVLADEPTGSRAWLGAYHYLAFYNRALTPAEVELNYLAGEGTQQPPAVDAGADRLVEFPGVAALQGTATDDGLPSPPGVLSLSWTKVSGPGSVSFGDPGAAVTDVAVDVPGVYKLRLSAYDGQMTSNDTVQVSVLQNEAPVVDAGADFNVEFPFDAMVHGSMSDEGLPDPPGFVATYWSLVSGPGTATFSDPEALTSLVSFSEVGTYVLGLYANDSAFDSTDTVTVDVMSNIAPTADAGNDSSVSVMDAGVLDGSVSDDGLPAVPGAVTVLWSQVSGPGTAVFADASAVDTTVRFDVVGSYLLRLTADDGVLQVSDDVTVLVRRPARATSGLEALYEFEEGAGSVVRDVSGAGSPLDLTIANPGRATWVPGALRVDQATMIKSVGGATAVNSAARASGQVTVEAWVEPAAVRPASPGRIVTLSTNGSLRNVTLGQGFVSGQATDLYRVRATTTGTVANPVGTVGTTALTHVVYTLSPGSGTARLYVNGVLVGTTSVSGNLSNWDLTRPLTLANEPSGGFAWLGAYHLVALYARALTASEVQANYLAGAGSELPPVADAGPNRVVEFPDAAVLDGSVSDDGEPNPPGAVTVLWSQVSGPGTAVFADASAVDTSVTFDVAGDYVLRLTADDGASQASDDVTVVSGTNLPPVVDAGPNRVVELTDAAVLDGSVSDDGLPLVPGAVTALWSQMSGPGTAVFADASAVDTSVTFDVAGDYVLRLTADDGVLQASNDVAVTVAPPQQVVTPVIAPAGGTFSNSVLVTITTATLGASIRYTTDGSQPSETSLLYSEPFSVAESMVVKAYATKAGRPDSLAAAASFTIVSSPRVTQGLVALYSFDEGGGSSAADTSGVGTPMNLSVADPSKVSWGGGALTVTGATTIGTGGSATKLINALKASNAMTVEAWITPAALNPAVPGRIASLSASESSRDFSVSQGFWAGGNNTIYESRLWTTANYNNPVSSGSTKVATHLSHVVLVKSASYVRLYVDGVQVGARSVSGTLNDWNSSYPFLLANEGTGDRPWLGTYHLVALYDRALEQSEVLQNWTVGPVG